MHQTQRKNTNCYSSRYFRNGAAGFCLIAAAALVLLFDITTLEAKSRTAKEYEIKAALIYKIAHFVEWPDEGYRNSQEIVLSILGKNPFGKALDTIRNKKIHGRRIVIRHIRTINANDPSQIVFISKSEKNSLNDHLKQVNKNILTISDTPNFTQRGVILNFISRGNNIRFEINMNALNQKDIRISSKLLRLAYITEGSPDKQ